MNTTKPWKTIAMGAWALLWLLLAITFVIPGLGDNPAYDRWRYLTGGVFVVLTLAGFGGNAWWIHRQAHQGKPRASGNIPAPVGAPGSAAPRKKTGADLPTVLRDRPKTGVAPAPLKPRAPVTPAPEASPPDVTVNSTAPVPATAAPASDA